MENQKATVEELGPTTLGGYLRSLRLKQNLSLDEMREKINKELSKQSLSLIELDKMKIPLARIKLITGAYCTTDDERGELHTLIQKILPWELRIVQNPEIMTLQQLLLLPKNSRQRVIAAVLAYDNPIPFSAPVPLTER